ncbi:MAG: hypothetical protein IJZ70_05115 [Bacteroidales bacterium]|nr:hypothetical protein [Bacteroidales bacterium]
MEEFMTLLTFPANLFLAVLWVAVCIITTRGRKFPVRFTTISSISLFLASCIYIGISGNRDFVHSLFFIIVLFYLQTTLLIVLVRGFRTPAGKIRYRFILNHAGLLIAISSAFWGHPDNEKLRMVLNVGETSHTAYRQDGGTAYLKEEITLKEIDAESYTASVYIGGSDESISVNHPFSSGLAQDIYIISTGRNEISGKEYCIFEIVREPWKYFALCGIIMMLCGAVLLFIKGPRSC